MNYLNLPELGIVLLQSGETPSSADLKVATARYGKGPSIYDVCKILGFFDTLPPLSAFGTDLQY